MMTQDEYIKMKTLELCEGMENYSIGDRLRHKSGFTGEVVEKLINSICLFHKARTKQGIDCEQWYFVKDIVKEFKHL